MTKQTTCHNFTAASRATSALLCERRVQIISDKHKKERETKHGGAGKFIIDFSDCLPDSCWRGNFGKTVRNATNNPRRSRNNKTASVRRCFFPFRKQLDLICHNHRVWKMKQNKWREDASVRSGAGVRVGARAQTFTCGRDGRPDRGYASRDNGRKRGRRIMRTWGR